MTKYNSLSEHLTGKINVSNTVSDNTQLNEGVSDFLSGLFKKGSSKENKAATGFLGTIGQLFSKLTKGDEDDRVTKKLREQEEELQKRMQKRQEDLMQAQEDALIAKLGADFEQQQNQLDLENNRRVEAYNLQKEMFEADKTFWENNKTSFTPEQCDAMRLAREKNYKNVGGLGTPDVKKMNNLMAIITTKDDGSPRSLAEIKDMCDENSANYDPKFAAKVNKFNSIAKKYGKEITAAMTSKDFEEQFEQFYRDGTEETHAKAQLKSLQQEKANFDTKSKEVEQFNKDKKAYNDAVTAHESAQAEISNFADGKMGGETKIYSVTGEGTVSLDVDANGIKQMLKTVASNPSEDMMKDGAIDVDKYCAYLESIKVPKSVIDKIKNKASDSNFKLDDSALDEAFENVDDNEWDSTKEGLTQHLQHKSDELQAAARAAKNAIPENKPSLTDKDSSGNPKYPNIGTLSESQIVEYDTTTDVGKANAEQIKNDVATAEETVSRIEQDKEVRKQRMQQAAKDEEDGESTDVPEAIKKKVANATQGKLAGEIMQNDKWGILAPDPDDPTKKKFIPKPDPDASAEEKANYEKARKQIIVMTPMSDFNPEDIHYEVGENGKVTYYKMEGNSKQNLSEEDAIRIYAKNQLAVLHNTELIKAKKEAADDLVKCIKNGELQMDKFKKLSPEKKALAIQIMSDPAGIDKYLEGTGISGANTISTIKKAIGDNKDEIKDFMDELANGVNDEDWEDVKDDDEDAEDESEYEDEIGNKLKNPAKEWKRKKKKNGNGMTKAYYRKNTKGEWESISAEEYKAKMEAYKKAKKAKQQSSVGPESFHYTNLGNHLFEAFNEVEVTIKTYTKLSKYLSNNVN